MFLRTLSALALIALIVVPPLTSTPDSARASVMLPPAPSADVVAAAAHRVHVYSETTRQENRADARKRYEEQVEQERREEEARRIEEHRQWHEEQDRLAAQRERAAKDVAPSVSSGSVWDRLAQCESGGNWAINSGNGYYGGLQFNLQTWQAYGGTGYPHEHSRETQIAIAENLRAARGFQPWPACSRKLGLR